jgi:hypothetical protein
MSILLKRCAVSVAAVAVLFLAGCSQSTTKVSASNQPVADKPAAPPEVVVAKTAFWPMYRDAHNWASDVVLLKIAAKDAPGYKNEDGKAAVWEATFGSPSQRTYRVYTYSIAEIPPSYHKGAVASVKMPWNGVSRDAMPVDLSMFNADSDAAYKAASADAADWLKKNPGKQVSNFEIGANYKFQAPVWYVMWGDKKGGYVAWVDANTGQVLKGKK